MASKGATLSVRTTLCGWPATCRALLPGAVILLALALALAAGTGLAATSGSSPNPPTVPAQTAAAITSTDSAKPRSADLELHLDALPNPVAAGAVLTYRVSVTNRGPDTAPGFVVRDSIPPQVTLQNANSSRGGVNHSGTLLEWTMGTLAQGSGATLDIVVIANQPGPITNTATVSLVPSGARPTTTAPGHPILQDPIDDNNSATIAARILGALTVENLATNGMSFDKEAGVFIQRIAVHNDSGAEVGGARVLVQGTAPSVTVRNATGTDAGTPYLDVKRPIPAGELAELRIEYAVTNQAAPPFPRLEARIGTGTNHTATTTAIPATNDAPTLSVRHVNGRLMLEFLSTPQRFYAIEYADVDRATGAKPWKRALTSIEIKSNAVQWIDDGPPKTDSLPTNRIYRLRIVDTNSPAGTNSVSTNSTATTATTNSPAAAPKP